MAQQLGTVVFGFHRYWPAGTRAEGLRAAIIGAGSAGLFALQLAKLAGFSEVIISDLEPARLEIAKRLGAVTVHAPDESFIEAVLAHTDGAGADLVIEAAGFDTCRADCVEAVRNHGRIGFFGLPEASGLVPFPLERAFRRACTIEMAGNAQLEPGLTSFREAVDLIATGKVDVKEFVESRYPLSDVTAAMQAAHERRAIKVSIDLAR
jgi:L-iditol 2-dehydrogenase